jgi:GntR family transcriptional regulator, transcriptional repressor for pyruvate dehydrogenase complex
MKGMLAPLKAESLKEVFISRFEDLILTGRLTKGQKLPPERELALQLGVSRPVVHEGLLDLAVKGLVTMKPRVGTVVNDYRREGSLAILESLVKFRQGNLEPELLDSLIDTRALVEIETARLASLNRTEEHLSLFREILGQEKALATADIEGITKLDFEFHHLIALASGNLIYPLLVNSFRPVYTTFTAIFFSDPAVLPVTFAFHERLVEAIARREPGEAEKIMSEVLAHGRDHLIKTVTSQRGERP